MLRISLARSSQKNGLENMETLAQYNNTENSSMQVQRLKVRHKCVYLQNQLDYGGLFDASSFILRMCFACLIAARLRPYLAQGAIAEEFSPESQYTFFPPLNYQYVFSHNFMPSLHLLVFIIAGKIKINMSNF